MFKPIRWKQFPRDFLVIQVGFLLFGLAITLMIRANLGTSAWRFWKLPCPRSCISRSGR